MVGLGLKVLGEALFAVGLLHFDIASIRKPCWHLSLVSLQTYMHTIERESARGEAGAPSPQG